MGQASITSFFGGAKRVQKEGPPNKNAEEPAKKLRRVARPENLGAFVHGSAKDPAFHAKEGNASRHEAFKNYFLGSRKKATGDARRAMKPYDLQFIDLKRRNHDAVLIIQNGYKYQILGEDAYQVARFLGRSPVSGWRSLDDLGDPVDALYDRFASLTFPLERLPFYVEKLVAQGLKIAVAKQLETSALKAQGDNKKGPFKREVTDVYSRGTMVEELTASSVVSGHVLALYQSGATYSLVGVQPTTGDGVYDSFKDTSIAMELETRLLHIQPSEIIVVGDGLSQAARKIIESLDVRVIPLDAATTDSEVGVDANAPDFVQGNPGLQQAWNALIEYLSDFNLHKALELDFHPFSLQSFMYLNGDTLNSLEIYANQTTGEVLGSLMWALDQTSTAFGRRLLRSWIGKPLLDRGLLADRVEASEEIMNSSNGAAASLFTSLRNSLGKMPDLERYTLQIYHGRISPKQLYWCLYFFDQLAGSVTEPQIEAAKLTSPMLIKAIRTLPEVKKVVGPLLSRINAQAARSDKDGADLATYFRMVEDDGDEHSQSTDLLQIDNLQMRIAECHSSFTKFLSEESAKLSIPLKHVRAFGEENTFVIGVAKKDTSKVPPTWRRQGAVASEVRFWAPYSMDQTKQLKPLLEELAVASTEAVKNFVAEIAGNHFEQLRAAVAAMAQLDCLFSLALVSSRPDYIKPDICDEPCLEIENGRHPMLEQLSLTTYIPNSVNMYATDNRTMIITGANMGGKSSFVRQTALIVIMSQIGYYVPAARARLSLKDAVYTRMGAFDNLLRGESTFMVELKECAAIMHNATQNSLVILDEIGRGTSTGDGVAIAEAVLRYMIEDVKSFTMFITHYPPLCDVAREFTPQVQNWSMDCSEADDEVTFLYKAVPKQASRSYGINVARLADLPSDILKAAEKKSAEFESEIELRKSSIVLADNLKNVLQGTADPDSLVRQIEEFPGDGELHEVDETQVS